MPSADPPPRISRQRLSRSPLSLGPLSFMVKCSFLHLSTASLRPSNCAISGRTASARSTSRSVSPSCLGGCARPPALGALAHLTAFRRGEGRKGSAEQGEHQGEILARQLGHPAVEDAPEDLIVKQDQAISLEQPLDPGGRGRRHDRPGKCK